MAKYDELPDQRVTRLNLVLNWFEELKRRAPRSGHSRSFSRVGGSPDEALPNQLHVFSGEGKRVPRPLGGHPSEGKKFLGIVPPEQKAANNFTVIVSWP